MNQFLAERVNTLPSSATLAMYQKVIDLKTQGHDIINLSIGDPDFETPQYIRAAAKQAIDSGAYFAYPPVAGYTDLRAAIAEKLYQENKIVCTPSQIIVSNGAKQSIANVFLSLLNPGDEVVVYAPYWVSYVSMIRLAGGNPLLLQGSLENNFEPTPEQLERAITLKTKAIIFSSPCNPTGQVFSRTSLEAMAAVLAGHKHVLVIADEIYEYINFIGEHTSMGAIEGMQDRVITINGFSKGFAMTGWRVGYMAAPQWIAQACEKIQGQITSACSSIAQRAALAAIQGDRKAPQAMAEAYRKRRDLMLVLLKELPGLHLHKPPGAFYLFPEVSDYFGRTNGKIVIHNAEELCMYLLQEGHVSLVAGAAFGAPKHVRLSYAVAEEQLKKAAQRIQEALKKLR